MAFIEEAPQKVETDVLSVKISVSNKRTLEAYANWLKYDSLGPALDRILLQVWKVDSGFRDWLNSHPEATQKSKRKASKPAALRVAS